MIDKIKEKGTLIIIALLATITSMSTISIRDSVIKEHDWKGHLKKRVYSLLQ